MRKILFSLIIGLLAFVPLFLKAEETHGGIISVKLVDVPQEIKAGEPLAIHLYASDENGKTWEISENTIFQVNDPRGQIEKNIYQAGKAGEWAIEASYGNFAAQAKIKVVPGPVSKIIINPNSLPEVINLNEQKKFSAAAYDKMGNLIEKADFHWTQEGNLGSIAQDGLFTAKKTGEGKVIASSGDISGSADIKIKEKTALAKVNPALTNSQTAASHQNNNSNTNESLSANDQEQNGEVAGAAAEAEENSNACQAFAWYWWLLIMIAYIGLLILYYFLIKKSKNNWWWLFPLALTVAAFWVYFQYSCQTNAWWPWVSIILALLVTLFRPRKFFEEPKEPTF